MQIRRKETKLSMISMFRIIASYPEAFAEQDVYAEPLFALRASPMSTLDSTSICKDAVHCAMRTCYFSLTALAVKNMSECPVHPRTSLACGIRDTHSQDMLHRATTNSSSPIGFIFLAFLVPPESCRQKYIVIARPWFPLYRVPMLISHYCAPL